MALAAAALVISAGLAAAAPIEWQVLEPGLELAVVQLPQRSESGDSRARIVRADPAHIGLRLLNTSAADSDQARTARQWAGRRDDIVAVTNAAMYQQDGLTSVSLMLKPGHVNNARVSKDKTILAFDPIDQSQAAVRLIDRGCDDFDTIRPLYRTLVQSIRMISCERRNVWAQRQARWSTAVVAVDGAGHFMFIHVRSPYSTHDLIENLLALPLDLRGAMYLEGGSPAQLFVHAGKTELEVVGSTGSAGVGGNRSARPFPNALVMFRLR